MPSISSSLAGVVFAGSLILSMLGIDAQFLSTLFLFTSLWLYTDSTAKYWVKVSMQASPPITWDGAIGTTQILQPLAPAKTSERKQDASKPAHKVPPVNKIKQKIFVQKIKPFKTPVFSGLPHQVLGVDPNANSNIIKAAHRFWIKEYHPDKAAQQATSVRRNSDKNTICLNEAREKMMQLRRAKRAA